MLFLDVPDLQALTQALSGVACAHSQSVLYGRAECYGTRGAGSDRKLYRDIEQQLVAEIAKSPQSPELHDTPMGVLTEKHARDTLKYLIATLNASFPDYDFRHIDPTVSFRREVDFGTVMGDIDNFLRGQLGAAYDIEEDHSGSTLRSRLLAAILKEIQPADCELYSYLPESDAFTEESIGSVDSIAIFFFNKKLRRVLFFTARAVSVSALDNIQGHPGQQFSGASDYGVTQDSLAPGWLAATQPLVQQQQEDLRQHQFGGARGQGQPLRSGSTLTPVQPTFSYFGSASSDTMPVGVEDGLFGIDGDFDPLEPPTTDPAVWDQMAYSSM